MLKSEKAPVVTLQVWVKTGSAHELSAEAGLSHFIEHLVFKGTKSFAPGEIAQIVESVGGELNAYTSFDQTVFYVTVPRKSLNVAAHVLSEMMTSPHFDSVEVDNEREVVIEEIKMGLDQPSRVASKMLFSQMYEGHPYALPVIGTEENIRRVEVQEIKDYFGERYVGKNMSLVCVGDFEDDAVSVLEQHFSQVKFEGLPARARTINPRKLDSENRIKIVKSDFEKDHFYLSWPVVGYMDESADAYDLLALLLGQGESSYLYKELKLKKGLCRSIGASYFGDAKEGIFVISGVATSEERPKLFEAIPGAIKDFLNQKDVSADLEKARNIFESESSYAEESIASLCRTIGDDWLYYGKPGVSEERKEKLLKLTEKDLCVAVKEIFSRDVYLSVLSKTDLSDQDKKLSKEIEGLREIKAQFVETDIVETAKFVQKIDSAAKDQEAFLWTTSKGSRVSFISQPIGSVVSFKVAFEGGELLASDDEQGLVSLFGSAWAREFDGMNEQKFIGEIDFYCSGFDAFAGKHSTGLNLITLKRHFDKLSGYFSRALNEAVFSKAVLQREKESLLQSLKTRVDRPSAVAFKEFSELLFKGSIYARDSVGVEEHIERLKTNDLEKFFEKMKSQKRVYSIVGNLTKAQVEEVVESIEESLAPVKESLFGEAFTFDRSGKKTSSLHSEKNQSHIIMGYPGFTYCDEKKIHLDLLTSLLGGQGGRLFIELRDKASLAYSVAPLEYSGLFGGYFGGYIACDPSKQELAIKMMREELHKLSTVEVSDDELMWMKNQVLGGFSMSSQKNSFICDTMLFDSLYGLDPLAYKKLESDLNKVSAKDLLNTISSILEGPEFLVSIG